MSGWYLVKETRAEDVDGFPALLRDMMWRANFTYQPEYAIYRRDRGPGMEEYRAIVNVIARQVVGSVPYCISVHATSEPMAVQEAARRMMSLLRHDLTELSQPPYDHFPKQGPRADVSTFEEIQFGEDPHVRQLARMVHIMDQTHRCLIRELWETRRRLHEAQDYLRLGVNMNRVPRNVLYGNNEVSQAAVAPPDFRFPEVAGLVPAYGQCRQARMTADFPRTLRTAPPGGHHLLLGSPRRLISPLDSTDTGSPEAHLLREFPVNFNRDLYASPSAVNPRE